MKQESALRLQVQKLTEVSLIPLCITIDDTNYLTVNLRCSKITTLFQLEVLLVSELIIFYMMENIYQSCVIFANIVASFSPSPYYFIRSLSIIFFQLLFAYLPYYLL